MIRRYFFTGLALLLPLVLTILIVAFFVNLLTKPFQNAVEGVLSHYGLMDTSFFIFSAEQIQRYLSKILIIFTIVGVTLCVGLFAQIIAAHYLIKIGDSIIHRIPVVRTIYKAAKEVVNTLFAEKRQAFSQVVLVPFPHDRAYSLAMVASETITSDTGAKHSGMISVFLPATPNPTMGFMLMFRKEQVIPLEMSVEDALKAIVSCGVVISELTNKRIDQEEK